MAERIAGQGIGAIDPQTGIEILEQLLASEHAYVAVQPVDWSRYLSATGSVPKWLSELPRQARRRAAPTVEVHGVAVVPRSEPAPPLEERLAAAAAGERRELLLEHVHEQVVRVIGLRPGEQVDPRQPLNELGVDSLMAVELRNRLVASLGAKRALPATLVFDHPTIAALTDYLAREVLSLTSPAPTDVPAEAPPDLLEQIEGLSDAEVERLFAGIEDA
jgi:hypothetical protein